VCEGCGDCSKQSNCLSVIPVETEYGRKRKIDQSSCNKDFSCLKGYCPSFVTLEGEVKPKRSKLGKEAFGSLPQLPAPTLPSIVQPWSVLVTGVGGTGVVTIGGVLGVAARIDEIGATVLDQTGLAQKGGAVTTHLRFAREQRALHAVRIAAGDANAVIGCDMVVTATNDCLAKMRLDHTRAIINGYEAATGDITKNPDMKFPAGSMLRTIEQAVGEAQFDVVDATQIATALMGDSIATNMFMLGFAWQRGLIPVSEAAIMQAIELNGAAIEMNKQAFVWGRHTAHDRVAVEKIAFPQVREAIKLASQTLDEFVARRVTDLTQYQDAAYAARFTALVDKVRAAERRVAPESELLSWAVARAYYKVLAYKDEYEVARLYTDGEFQKQLAEQFDGNFTLQFSLGPTWLQWLAKNGQAKKFKLGGWVMGAFGMLAKMKGLRGSALDVFGYAEDRKVERRLIGEFEQSLDALLAGLTQDKLPEAAAIVELTRQIRGYGHIKLATYEATKRDWDTKLAAYQGKAAPAPAEAKATVTP
jgi:indolepyruvate ferredoxin oxidoreductase